VEIKSVEVLAPVHKKQLLTYLRLADKRLGLLITSTSYSSREESHASSTGLKMRLTQSRQAAKTLEGRAQYLVGLRSKTSLSDTTVRLSTILFRQPA
jgi:hypothetical protein